MIISIVIFLLSVLTIVLAITLEKEKRDKCDLIIKLQNKEEAFNALYKEHNSKSTALNKTMQELTEQHNSALNRLGNASSQRDHYKNKFDSLTKEVDSLKGKLSNQIKVNKKLFEENSGAVLKIAQLEEQLLFANNTPAAATQAFGPGTAESEQVPDPEAEQASQPTTSVRKPRRPRARTNKQAR